MPDNLPTAPPASAPPAGAAVTFDFTTDPHTWSKAQDRAYQQMIADAYTEAAATGNPYFACVATGSLRTQRACKCPHCKGAVAAAAKQTELTGYVPTDSNLPASPGLINLSDPRLANDPTVKALLSALLEKLK